MLLFSLLLIFQNSEEAVLFHSWHISLQYFLILNLVFVVEMQHFKKEIHSHKLSDNSPVHKPAIAAFVPFLGYADKVHSIDPHGKKTNTTHDNPPDRSRDLRDLAGLGLQTTRLVFN